jgi:hypothetical protein
MFSTFWLLIISVIVFEHLANARSVPREKQERNDNSRLVLRAVYDPEITNPNAATTWVVGSTTTVTWYPYPAEMIGMLIIDRLPYQEL